MSASDTGEYMCQAQNGYGTPMWSDAVRMEAGEAGVRSGSVSADLGWGSGSGSGSAFPPGFGGGVSRGSEPPGP